MTDQDEQTFIEKIEKLRTFAHRPISSDSDLDLTEATQKSEYSNESESMTDNCPCSFEDARDRQARSSGHNQSTQVIGSDETNSRTRNLGSPVGNHAKADTSDKNLETAQYVVTSDSRTETTNSNVGSADIQKQDQSGGTSTHRKDNDGLQAGQLFYIDGKTSELSTFTSFDELSEHLLNLKTCPKRDTLTDDFLKTVVSVSVRNSINHVTVGEYLKLLHTRNQMVDVIVEVRGEKFPAHRVVLCCHSIYFNNLFLQTKNNTLPFDLKIKGISADSFASFLEFCYTGEINVYPDIAADLLILSDYLQVSALRKRCAAITGTIPVGQALKFIVNSKANRNHEVYESLYDRVLKNFYAATKFDEFLEMDIETLCKLLSSDHLVIQSETDAFNAVVRWILHNVEDRVKYTTRLMALVRLCHMSAGELIQCVETTSFVRSYDKFREIILIANWQRTSQHICRDDPFGFPGVHKRLCFVHTGEQPPVTSTSQPMSATPTPANPFMMSLVAKKIREKATPMMDILMIGGHTSEDPTQNQFVERYHIGDNNWTHFCKLPAARKDHAVITSMGKLYVIGGREQTHSEQDPQVVKSLYALDLHTKTWTKMADMLNERYSHCVCAVDDKLYAIGGKNQENRVLKSVECYDPQTDSWTFIDPMNSPRYSASAAKFAGSIIVTGGIGENCDVPTALPVLNTVEMYSFEKKSWTQRNNLRHPRCCAKLVQCTGRLYLCCGATRSYNFKSSVLVSVTSLDQYDEEGDVWCHAADMVIPRHDAGVVAAGGKLYIMGGVSTAADRELQSVECYNTRTGKWESGLEDLPTPTGSAACVTLSSIPKLDD